MQFTPLDKNARADWREMLGMAKPLPFALVLVMLAFSLLALPLSRVYAVSALFLLFAVLYYYTFTRSVFSLLLVALPGLFLYGVSAAIPALPHALMLPACYAALLLGSVTGAFAIVQCRKRPQHYLPLIALPLAAFACVWLITRSPFQALLVLLPVGIAVALAYCVLTCRPQTASLVLICAVIVATAVAAWLISLTVLHAWTANPLVTLVEQVRAGIVSFYRETLQMYEEMAGLYGVQQMPIVISKNDIDNIAALVGNILPGLCVAAACVLSFALWRMLLRMLCGFGIMRRVPARLALLTVSPVAAGVFALTFVASLIANGSTATLFGTVCENVSLVLEPALALVGFSVLLGQGKNRSCLSLLLALGLLVMLVVNPATGLALAALVGAFHILAAHILPHDKGEQ